MRDFYYEKRVSQQDKKCLLDLFDGQLLRAYEAVLACLKGLEIT